MCFKVMRISHLKSILKQQPLPTFSNQEKEDSFSMVIIPKNPSRRGQSNIRRSPDIGNLHKSPFRTARIGGPRSNRSCRNFWAGPEGSIAFRSSQYNQHQYWGHFPSAIRLFPGLFDVTLATSVHLVVGAVRQLLPLTAVRRLLALTASFQTCLVDTASEA